MAQKLETIELHQTLTLSLRATSRDEVRRAFEQCTGEGNWHRLIDLEKYSDQRKAFNGGGMIAFERNSIEGSLVVRLTLWPEGETEQPSTNFSYKLGNIVPAQYGKQLSVHEYNDILSAFLRDVIEPVREELGGNVKVSTREVSITSWTSAAAAEALSHFSDPANMSQYYPLDEARFREFVIADHRAKGKLKPSLLRRWLTEVDRWPEDVADELVSDWQKGRELLAQFESCK